MSTYYRVPNVDLTILIEFGTKVNALTQPSYYLTQYGHNITCLLDCICKYTVKNCVTQLLHIVQYVCNIANFTSTYNEIVDNTSNN